MGRFYVSPDSIKGGKIHVGQKESHHIIDVMRLAGGDSVTVFDGSGKEYQGKIDSIKNKSVVINIKNVRTVEKKQSTSITLAQSIPKKDKMDLIVQKATELGVDEIIPVESSRTIVRTGRRKKGHKIDRWRKIIVEASKQCGRNELPRIKDVIYFDKLLNSAVNYNLVIMPCLSDRCVNLKFALSKTNKPDKVLAIIGPEGGFTEDEIDRASKKGVVLVSLGQSVLKSETAAITILSILNYEYIH